MCSYLQLSIDLPATDRPLLKTTKKKTPLFFWLDECGPHAARSVTRRERLCRLAYEGMSIATTTPRLAAFRVGASSDRRDVLVGRSRRHRIRCTTSQIPTYSPVRRLVACSSTVSNSAASQVASCMVGGCFLVHTVLVRPPFWCCVHAEKSWQKSFGTTKARGMVHVWTAAEIELLHDAVDEFGCQWRVLTERLAPDGPRTQCATCINVRSSCPRQGGPRRHGRQPHRVEAADEETERLVQLVLDCDLQWSEIGRRMGRRPHSVRNRWRQHILYGDRARMRTVLTSTRQVVGVIAAVDSDVSRRSTIRRTGAAETDGDERSE